MNCEWTVALSSHGGTSQNFGQRGQTAVMGSVLEVHACCNSERGRLGTGC